MASYYLDLSRISLGEFFDTLREGNISPGRIVLLERKKEHQAALQHCGIVTLGDLVEQLKTKTRVGSMVAKTGLSTEYLTILRRQAMSYLPMPVPLTAFPGINGSPGLNEVITALAKRGIVHGKHLFDAIDDQTGLRSLTEGLSTNLSPEELTVALRQLLTLVDFTRINGVGPVSARMLFTLGFHSLSDLAAAEATTVHQQLLELTQESAYTGVKVTKWDVQNIIKMANLL